MADIHEDRYGWADVCRALPGRNPLTLKSWAERQVPGLSDDKTGAGAGKGRHRKFSLERVYQFAIVDVLVSMGLPPARAGWAALAFTDEGDDPAGYAGDGSRFGREVGGLYANDETYLVIEPHDGSGAPFEGVRVVPGSEVDGVAALFRGKSEAVTVLRVDWIINRIRLNLGLTPANFVR